MCETRVAGPQLSAEQRLEIAKEALLSLKAVAPVVLDLRELTVITDYFLIGHGTSNIHVRALADRVLEQMKEQGIRKHGNEGYTESRWILLDYGDVIVHIFAAEEREFYALERLWSDAPREDLASADEQSDE